MTFEEEFPSLNGMASGTQKTNRPELRTERYFGENEVQKFCLDKERVRKAIKKVCCVYGFQAQNGRTMFRNLVCRNIKKKLLQELDL